MGMRRLPPRTKTLLQAITAGLAILAVAMGAQMWVMVGKTKRAQAPLSAGLAEPVADRTLDALGAIPFSAPSPAQKAVNGGGRANLSSPALDTSGLDLKGVFVNMFDKRKSIAIIGSKGKRDLILKRGDPAKEGVMVDDIFPDHVVFRGVAGDTRSLALSNFVRDAVIFGGNSPMEPTMESLSDIENPMGTPVFDPASPDPGMAGDVMGDAGADPGPMEHMPTPQMPMTGNDGSQMAAPMVGGSDAAKALSEEMNAAGHMPGEGK